MKYSKLFIVPPSGFQLMLNSLGYQNNETGAHFIAHQNAKSFESIKNRFTEKYFLNKQYKIIEIKKMTINHLSACWYSYESSFIDKTTIKNILIIGNENEYAMIESLCPKEYPAAELALRKSIFSVYYDMDSTYIKKIQP
jgi:hypothetical protein